MNKIQKYPERKLLVEGQTDKFFIAELWKKLTKSDAIDHFEIIVMGGKERLIEGIQDSRTVEIWDPETTHLGIVIDADQSAASTLQSVADALERSGYPKFSRILNPQGIVQQIKDRKMGVWVMPDNNCNGMTEDLFLRLMDSSSRMPQQRIFAEETLKELEARRLEGYSQERYSKALTHTVLAWQEEPGLALGNAVQKNFITPQANLPLIAWLRRLFCEDQ